MRHTPNEREGRIALLEHAVSRAIEARRKCAGRIDASAILRLLSERDIVRFPTALSFDDRRLEPGEFGQALARGEHPSHGFDLVLRRCYEIRPEVWPMLIAYHIPPINYGDIVTPEVCEAFGAALLGMDVEAYYEELCRLTDESGS